MTTSDHALLVQSYTYRTADGRPGSLSLEARPVGLGYDQGKPHPRALYDDPVGLLRAEATYYPQADGTGVSVPLGRYGLRPSYGLLDEAQAMQYARTLRTVDRKLGKVQQQFGQPADAAQFLAYFAAAIGAETIFWRTDNGHGEPSSWQAPDWPCIVVTPPVLIGLVRAGFTSQQALYQEWHEAKQEQERLAVEAAAEVGVDLAIVAD